MLNDKRVLISLESISITTFASLHDSIEAKMLKTFYRAFVSGSGFLLLQVHYMYLTCNVWHVMLKEIEHCNAQ